jgi:aryl-alcohol dehydrogenase-like predicted oxidoreductase
MQYARLGKSGPDISRIALGCMSLSASHEAEGIRIIHRAIDLGINFIDTADLYEKGLNEVLVGKALKDKRKNLVLATKVGNQWRNDGSGWDWNPGKEYIIASVEESLRRLQTDYIDLYQLHGGTIEDSIDETIEAFETLQVSGKILHYGISSIRPNVIRAYASRSRITSVMMQYSLLDRRPEEAMLDLLQDHGIGVLVRGPLAQGLLAGKPARAYLEHDAVAVKSAQEVIRLCTTEVRTAARVALGYVLAHPAVTCAVAGARTLSQLEDMAGVFDTEALAEKEMDRLRQSIPVNMYADHR